MLIKSFTFTKPIFKVGLRGFFIDTKIRRDGYVCLYMFRFYFKHSTSISSGIF